MLGYDVKLETSDEVTEQTPKKENQVGEGPVPAFGLPEQYKGMTKKEKFALSRKMMDKHKAWAGQNKILKG